MTSNGLYTNEPRPRLCHLRRWPDFNGYGFNLHCEKAKPGQYIGKVDPNSPAESAGLRENDRIIEVNFVPIGNENHKQVVARIKEGVSRNNTRYSDEVILLVVDQQTDEYYRKKSKIIRSTDANVEKLETEIREDSHYPQQPSPQTRPKDKYVVDQTETYHKNTNSSPAISRTSEQDYDPSEDNQSSHRSTPPVSDKDKRKEYSASTNSYTNKNPSPKSPVRDFHQTRTTTTSSQSSASANGDGGLLNFHMSAAEYREKLKAQSARKRDPRQSQQMSMKEKHQVIDQL